ncbi:hypothetical protein A3D83_01075 [Candidatus Daviesbacteria bacterium RIFCSPHIGHO2_02_FULL_41_10]|uniref:DUF5667 domain-containing protein n=1 Tax=Candidatus Daviesbacteria bacterium RIFCSPHIGHO2_02_FULL_41_10 TaxID=1797774 RepID=A0A1F5JY07_9BACT|nr:MAG: hypothetical protein A3D83_01075 [Candidatus Daviesbacteria bacterium RIFCSPHIGHO2_02_FULL_41_10]
MLIKFTIYLLIFVLCLNYTQTVSALKKTLVSEQELKETGFTEYESINPNLLIYPLKQLVEKAKLNLFVNKNSKVKYKYTLLDLRFRELVFIINFQKTGFLEEAVGRYNSYLGDLMINHKGSALDYKDTLSGYINVLKNLQDRYDNISSYRLLIQQAIDTTRRLI